MSTKKLDKQRITIRSEDDILAQIKDEHTLEMEMLMANNKKLLAVIGHDIKSPMSSIIGFLSLLKERIIIIDKAKIEEYIDIALLSARKTYTILDNLLEWSFAENALKSFQQKYFDLYVLIHSEIDNIEFVANQKEIKINAVNIPHVDVFIDIDMIQTIFRNLLTNAVKYSHKLGGIVISARQKKRFVEISIKDNGVGIRQNVQDLIFTSNNYHSTNGTNNEIGNGFGLLLCKEFIDAHGGKIKVISFPGKGTEFKFTLPVG